MGPPIPSRDYMRAACHGPESDRAGLSSYYTSAAAYLDRHPPALIRTSRGPVWWTFTTKPLARGRVRRTGIAPNGLDLHEITRRLSELWALPPQIQAQKAAILQGTTAPADDPAPRTAQRRAQRLAATLAARLATLEARLERMERGAHTPPTASTRPAHPRNTGLDL
jgi:hypothetical protein